MIERQADVVLACMPFGPLQQPSLGLALLRAALPPERTCRILYMTIPFAERIGAALYTRIAEGLDGCERLVGEWLFSRGLRPRSDAEDLAYMTELAVAPGDEPTRQALWNARALVVPYLDACVDTILAMGPRVVGLTSLFQQHAASLALARRLKEASPSIAVVLGGASCEGVMGLETVRSFPWVDAVVSGEGDLVFPELVERVMARRPLDGMAGVVTPALARSWVGAGAPPGAPRVDDLDRLPVPDHGDFLAQWRASPVSDGRTPRLLMETARGCWWGEVHHCTFCGLNGEGMAFRSKSPERAREELAILATLAPGAPVLMVDDIIDAAYLRTFLPLLRDRGPRVDLFYETKANLTRAQVALLADAGVREIQPGIESLSDEVLRLMRKGVRALQNVALLRWCRELGVRPYWNVIWGFPGEPPGEYQRMALLVPLLHHLPPPDAASCIRLDRFSPLHERPEAFGLRDVRPVPAYRHVYDMGPFALGNVAYFFDYEHGDGRDVPAYTETLAASIAAWKAQHPRSELACVDRGTELVVIDTRAAARQRVTRLTAPERAVLLACDGPTSPEGVARATSPEVDGPERESALARLQGLGFIVEHETRLLGLPVLAAASAPRAAATTRNGVTRPGSPSDPS